MLPLVAGAAWFLLRQPELTNRNVTTPVQTTLHAAESPVRSNDADRIQLAHAEQRLVAAAEHLNKARRLLSALSPQLTRVYLQNEKRSADAAWTACDTAQRALEEALDDVRLTANRKE